MLECFILPLLVGAALFYLLSKWIEEAPRSDLPSDREQASNSVLESMHPDKLKNSSSGVEKHIEAVKHSQTSDKTIVSAGYPGEVTLLDLQRFSKAQQEERHFRPYLKRIRTYKSVALAIAPSLGRLQMEQIGFGSGRWCPFILLLTKKELIVYPESPDMREFHRFDREQLRWFGHPDPRQPPDAEHLYLHFEVDGRWWVLRMAVDDHDMLRILAALRDFAPALMPPYHRGLHVHYGPIPAHRAEQQITGEWMLYEQCTLYLMPLYVVVLDGETVHELLPVESITHVASLPRLDAPGRVVRFRVAGDELAYALDDYFSFAAALAEAAKDSLEEPLEIVERKGKKHNE